MTRLPALYAERAHIRSAASDTLDRETWRRTSHAIEYRIHIAEQAAGGPLIARFYRCPECWRLHPLGTARCTKAGLFLFEAWLKHGPDLVFVHDVRS
jgi:hypothetical protein